MTTLENNRDLSYRVHHRAGLFGEDNVTIHTPCTYTAYIWNTPTHPQHPPPHTHTMNILHTLYVYTYEDSAYLCTYMYIHVYVRTYFIQIILVQTLCVSLLNVRYLSSVSVSSGTTHPCVRMSTSQSGTGRAPGKTALTPPPAA